MASSPETLLDLPGCHATSAAMPRWDALSGGQAHDVVVEEVPVALVYNGVSHAVMLASPGDLEDFALGFTLTEGIVDAAAQVHDIDVTAAEAGGVAVHLSIGAASFAALKERRRALLGRTGCGLCGVESLAQALRAVPRVPHGGPPIALTALRRAVGALAARQPLYRATGASHGAALADRDGSLRLVREDVGRHNALDKLAGAMAAAGHGASGGFVVITSRASYEMVHKAAAIGTPLLAALSAPTAMAVRSAAQAGIALAGFAGRARPVVYSHPERLSATVQSVCGA